MQHKAPDIARFDTSASSAQACSTTDVTIHQRNENFKFNSALKIVNPKSPFMVFPVLYFFKQFKAACGRGVL
jgi:hypothetical protein